MNIVPTPNNFRIGHNVARGTSATDMLYITQPPVIYPERGVIEKYPLSGCFHSEMWTSFLYIESKGNCPKKNMREIATNVAAEEEYFLSGITEAASFVHSCVRQFITMLPEFIVLCFKPSETEDVPDMALILSITGHDSGAALSIFEQPASLIREGSGILISQRCTEP